MTMALDFANMSDDDFMKASLDTIVKEASTEASESMEEKLDQSYSEDVDSAQTDVEEQIDVDTDIATAEEFEQEEQEPTEQEEPEVQEEESTEDSQLAELFKPLKANGVDFTVKDIDEARRLIQMGLGYADKMAALKPHRKLLKMLDNNNLLDEAKLNNLIDLASGNKDAITKLIKDSGIDPLDIDTQQDNGYTPSDHSVTDQAVELDEVIESIRSSAKFTDTMQLVTRQWDDASKQSIVQQPQLLAVLNNHMESGLYALVQERMMREKLLGNLSGVSDLVAYQTAGQMIYNEGGMTKYFPTQGSSAKPVVVHKAPQQDVSALNEQKRKLTAQKPTKPTPRKQVVPDFLNMSDEDFEKFSF